MLAPCKAFRPSSYSNTTNQIDNLLISNIFLTGNRKPKTVFFLVPKLQLGNADFTSSSAWGHLDITYNLFKLEAY
jgi:hypothetical protein